MPRYQDLVGTRNVKSTRPLYAYVNIAHPMVAWEAYIGRLASSDIFSPEGFLPLSLWHVTALKPLTSGDPRRLAAELRLEALRARQWPAEVSRLRGLFFFETAETARKASERWGGSFRSENLIQVGVSALAMTRVDSEWITHDYYSTDDAWIAKYWAGEPRGRDPIWEVLISGIGMAWGTELRESAHEVVKQASPRSLGLLELARVSFDMGFSLGQVVPFVTTAKANRFKLNYILDLRDATNPQFRDDLLHYAGPKNTAELHPGVELALPDLRSQMFEFSLPYGLAYPAISTRVPDHGQIGDLGGRFTP